MSAVARRGAARVGLLAGARPPPKPGAPFVCAEPRERRAAVSLPLSIRVCGLADRQSVSSAALGCAPPRSASRRKLPRARRSRQRAWTCSWARSPSPPQTTSSKRLLYRVRSFLLQGSPFVCKSVRVSSFRATHKCPQRGAVAGGRESRVHRGRGAQRQDPEGRGTKGGDSLDSLFHERCKRAGFTSRPF